MRKRTLSIGGATEDLFVRLPKDTLSLAGNTDVFALPLGAKIRVQEVIEATGGGAANTAVGLSRLGCDALFEGVVGSDQWGQKLIETLQKEGVDTSLITIVENEVSSFSIILSGNCGERVILYDPGTNEHLHDMNFDTAILTQVDWIYLNHLQEGSCVIQDNIVEMLEAAESPRLSWNPGGCQIEKGLNEADNRALLAHTTLLLLNKEEALLFTGEQTTERSIRVLLDAGADIVAVTDGSRGSVACDGTALYRCPVVPDTHVTDTTGAGDAFGTGMTWGLLEGMSLSDALKTGNISAASVVGSIGAQTALLTDTQIRKRLKEVKLTVSVESL